MQKYINKFWYWYEENLHVNLAVASFLFSWQLLHLVWLSLDVVLENILGVNIITISGIWENLIVLVDYTEIPALLSVSLVYLNEFRKDRNFKSLLYLIFLNSQWLHIFWITDEFVEASFGGAPGTILPFWLAWVAIGIDYLELPVMYDTIKRAISMMFNKK